MRSARIAHVLVVGALVLGAASLSGAQLDTAYDHLQCYRINGAAAKRTVTLEDQFGTTQAGVVKPVVLCLPTRKTPADPDPVEATAVHPFKCYKVRPQSGNDTGQITVTDQFGRETVRVGGRSRLLCTPAKVDSAEPACCPVCGDGMCEGDETACSCWSDGCPPHACLTYLPSCGNGYCEISASPGESHERCPQDCPLACVSCP